MVNPIYFPILRARAGEIEAIGRLSPASQALVRPFLDFPRQRDKDRRPLGEYLADKIQEIGAVWGTKYELYLDFSRYAPELSVETGQHFLDFVFEVANQTHIKAMPVSGPLSLRGPSEGYLRAVVRAVEKYERGMAFRVPFEDFVNLRVLERAVAESRKSFSLVQSRTDICLDAGPLRIGPTNNDDFVDLLDLVRAAVSYLSAEGFRRIIFAGSSLPDSMVKHRPGQILRFPRLEYRLWLNLVQEGMKDLSFGDYGIIHPQQIESDVPVVPPSRVRTSSEDEFVLRKLGRRDIRELARLASEGGDLKSGVNSWGENAIRECAAGYGDPGGPTAWISRDTNMHIERTLASMARRLGLHSIASGSVSTDERRPWLQSTIFSET